MDTVIFALAAVAFALLIQRFFLLGCQRLLRAKEQAFEFHRLRDELQLAAAEGIIKPGSLAFEFLMQMLNVAIRNAGILTLTQSLALAKKVSGKSDRGTYEAAIADIEKHGPRVQQLAGGFFHSFARMLLANDWLVSAVIALTRHHLSNQLVVEPARSIRRLRRYPRVQLIGYVRRYFDWSQRLSPC